MAHGTVRCVALPRMGSHPDDWSRTGPEIAITSPVHYRGMKPKCPPAHDSGDAAGYWKHETRNPLPGCSDPGRPYPAHQTP